MKVDKCIFYLIFFFLFFFIYFIFVFVFVIFFFFFPFKSFSYFGVVLPKDSFPIGKRGLKSTRCNSSLVENQFGRKNLKKMMLWRQKAHRIIQNTEFYYKRQRFVCFELREGRKLEKNSRKKKKKDHTSSR